MKGLADLYVARGATERSHGPLFLGGGQMKGLADLYVAWCATERSHGPLDREDCLGAWLTDGAAYTKISIRFADGLLVS